MLSLSKVKYLKSLHQKKYRRREKKVLLEGFRLIEQALQAEGKVEEVWMSTRAVKSEPGKQLQSLLQTKSIPLSKTTDPLIRQVSDSKNDQGIIALAAIPQYENLTKTPSQALYLDGISDPGNLGTLLRTAAWFGVQAVYISPDSVDPFNSKVIRSAMGAQFYFSILDATRGEEKLKNLSGTSTAIIGGDHRGKSLDNLATSKFENWVLVLGSEAWGIRKSVEKFLTHKVSIPGSEGMESLNVSVAGGIILNTLIFG